MVARRGRVLLVALPLRPLFNFNNRSSLRGPELGCRKGGSLCSWPVLTSLRVPVPGCRLVGSFRSWPVEMSLARACNSGSRREGLRFARCKTPRDSQASRRTYRRRNLCSTLR